MDIEILPSRENPGHCIDLTRVVAGAGKSIPAKTQGLLLRMFADPYLLEKEDRVLW